MRIWGTIIALFLLVGCTTTRQVAVQKHLRVDDVSIFKEISNKTFLAFHRTINKVGANRGIHYSDLRGKIKLDFYNDPNAMLKMAIKYSGITKSFLDRPDKNFTDHEKKMISTTEEMVKEFNQSGKLKVGLP